MPTIAYHGAGGLSESIVDGRTGMLVDSLESMTDAVRGLIDDEPRRARMAEDARTHSQRYTWEACVDAWERLLDEVSLSRRS